MSFSVGQRVRVKRDAGEIQRRVVGRPTAWHSNMEPLTGQCGMITAMGVGRPPDIRVMFDDGVTWYFVAEALEPVVAGFTPSTPAVVEVLPSETVLFDDVRAAFRDAIDNASVTQLREVARILKIPLRETETKIVRFSLKGGAK